MKKITVLTIASVLVSMPAFAQHHDGHAEVQSHGGHHQSHGEHDDRGGHDDDHDDHREHDKKTKKEKHEKHEKYDKHEKHEKHAMPKGLEKQHDKKAAHVQKELDKGSAQGQEARQGRKKWWKFWGDE